MYGLLTVFGVSVVIFVVMRVLPGDPLVALFGPEGYIEISAAERAGCMVQFGLSDPPVVQYWHWMRDTASGSFGRCFVLDIRAAGVCRARADQKHNVTLP